MEISKSLEGFENSQKLARKSLNWQSKFVYAICTYDGSRTQKTSVFLHTEHLQANK